eukprot:110663-Rhodomonas_salina.1
MHTLPYVPVHNLPYITMYTPLRPYEHSLSVYAHSPLSACAHSSTSLCTLPYQPMHTPLQSYRCAVLRQGMWYQSQEQGEQRVNQVPTTKGLGSRV